MSIVKVHAFTADFAQPIVSQPLGYSFTKGDALTQQFDITVNYNGTGASLAGVSASIDVIRKDGGTVYNAATINGSVISAALSAESCAIVGRIYIQAWLTIGTQKIKVWERYTSVEKGQSDVVVDPGAALPSLEQIAAYIAANSVYEAWDNATVYNQYNHVTFGGSTYMWNSATPSVAGVDPDESASWMLMAEKGDTGAQTNVFFKWSATEPDGDDDLKDTVDEWIGVYAGIAATAPTTYTSYTWYQYKGAAGATGAQTYVHFKWSATEPDGDEDMGDTPNAWIGVYSGTSAAAPTAYTSYAWYEYKGATGAAGADFVILGTYADLTALRAAVPSPAVSLFYNVGASAPYTIYRSTGEANPNDWESQGTLEGAGVAIGGTTGQFLKKKSGTDYDTEWGAVPAASTSAAGLAPQATAPAAGLRNVMAIDNGETAYTNKALFDATSPSTQAFGDAAAVGTAMTVARIDHKHAMPTAGIANGNAVKIDAADVADDDFARFTANGLEGRSAAETLADIGAQAKATITENTDAAPALGTIANNTEYRCTHGTPTDAPSMTIATIAANTTEFACNVIYKAEATTPSAPAVTNSSGKTIKYQGDGVAAGTFTPVAGTVYRLGWLWDGIYLNCYIKGA